MRSALALLLTVLLQACATAPLNAPVPTGNATLYVVGRGWHTDVGLPVDEITGPLRTLEQDFPGSRFMVFGFGERRYYMAPHAGSAETIAALFPSKSAILMTALNAPPQVAFEGHEVVTLHLPQQSIDRIAARLWQALEKSPDGAAVRLADGPYAGSVFYAANETYDAFYTCNTWTALVLRQGGVPVDPRGVLFAEQVMQQVTQIASDQSK